MAREGQLIPIQTTAFIHGLDGVPGHEESIAKLIRYFHQRKDTIGSGWSVNPEIVVGGGNQAEQEMVALA